MTPLTYVVITTFLIFSIDHRPWIVSAQDITTCLQSQTCDEFRSCCEKSCPVGATPICHAEAIGTVAPSDAKAVATTKAAVNRGENAFMAGGAAPDEGAPAPAAAVSGGDNSKIAGAQCICNEQKSFVVAMTMACLTSLDAPDKCGEFEKCCKETCSKHAAHAFLCAQESDGSAGPETECTCFNSLAALPGWSELEKSKDGGAVPEDEKSQYEDHHGECFNSTDSCQTYTDCCTAACKKLESTGEAEPLTMCVANKFGVPMMSTHTFCKCPKKAAVFGIQLWSEGGGGGKEDVASVFKGGDDYDAGVTLAPFAMFGYVLIGGIVMLRFRI